MTLLHSRDTPISIPLDKRDSQTFDSASCSAKTDADRPLATGRERKGSNTDTSRISESDESDKAKDQPLPEDLEDGWDSISPKPKPTSLKTIMVEQEKENEVVMIAPPRLGTGEKGHPSLHDTSPRTVPLTDFLKEMRNDLLTEMESKSEERELQNNVEMEEEDPTHQEGRAADPHTTKGTHENWDNRRTVGTIIHLKCDSLTVNKLNPVKLSRAIQEKNRGPPKRMMLTRYQCLRLEFDNETQMARFKGQLPILIDGHVVEESLARETTNGGEERRHKDPPRRGTIVAPFGVGEAEKQDVIEELQKDGVIGAQYFVKKTLRGEDIGCFALLFDRPLPSHVVVGFRICNVRASIDKRVCTRCQGVGHAAKTCRHDLACGYCAEKHATEDCPVKPASGNQRQTKADSWKVAEDKIITAAKEAGENLDANELTRRNKVEFDKIEREIELQWEEERKKYLNNKCCARCGSRSHCAKDKDACNRYQATIRIRDIYANNKVSYAEATKQGLRRPFKQQKDQTQSEGEWQHQPKDTRKARKEFNHQRSSGFDEEEDRHHWKEFEQDNQHTDQEAKDMTIGYRMPAPSAPPTKRPPLPTWGVRPTSNTESRAPTQSNLRTQATQTTTQDANTQTEDYKAQTHSFADTVVGLLSTLEIFLNARESGNTDNMWSDIAKALEKDTDEEVDPVALESKFAQKRQQHMTTSKPMPNPLQGPNAFNIQKKAVKPGGRLIQNPGPLSASSEDGEIDLSNGQNKKKRKQDRSPPHPGKSKDTAKSTKN